MVQNYGLSVMQVVEVAIGAFESALRLKVESISVCQLLIELMEAKVRPTLKPIYCPISCSIHGALIILSNILSHYTISLYCSNDSTLDSIYCGQDHTC
jgi:hypothetical protein